MADMRIRYDPAITTADGLVTPAEYEQFHSIGGDLTGDGVHVLVVDSGIDAGHPFFADKDVAYRDFTGSSESADDAVGHGTWVTGAIQSVAPDAKMTVYRVFGDSGKGGGDALMKAYKAAIQNADKFDIANFSLGFPRRVREVDALHNRLVGAGVRDVVAAGNSGGRGGSPATAKQAFSAGAVTINGEVTNFSDYNPERDNPDVSLVGRDVLGVKARGTDMLRSVPADKVPDGLPGGASMYGKGSGTSISAPILTGMVAQYVEAEKAGAIPKMYEATARPIRKTPREGAGIADQKAALSSGGGGDGGENHPTVSGGEFGFIPGSDTLYLSADWIPDGAVKAEKLDEGDDSVTIRFTGK